MRTLPTATQLALLAPWAGALTALAALVAVTSAFPIKRYDFGSLAILLDAPLLAIWFLSMAKLGARAHAAAVRPAARRARRFRTAALVALGAALVAPVCWRLFSAGAFWFGRSEQASDGPRTMFFVALFLGGEAILGVAAIRAFGPQIRHRAVVAVLSFILLVTPPDIAPVKLALSLTFIGAVAALAVSLLIASEDRARYRVRRLRFVVLLAATVLAFVAASAAPAMPDTRAGFVGFLAMAALSAAGAVVAYTVLAFAATDLTANLAQRSKAIRTRMVLLAVVAAGAGFAMRALDFQPHLPGLDGEYRGLAVAGFNLATSCVLVWVFAMAMARRLSRSIEQSVAALGSIRRGDLSVSLPESGGDEMAEVARTFNAMVGQLRQAQFLERINADLQSRSAELQRTLEALRTAQAELVRAEKMASVATLVQGIAHELNNPIGFISGNVPLLRRYCDFLVRVAGTLADGKPRSPEEVRALAELTPAKDLEFVTRDLLRMTDDIAEGARRAMLIISDLQGLTGQSQRAIEEVDLHRAVRQTLSLLGPRAMPRIRVETELEPVPPIAARAGQLEQVLVNLVDNAIRAVGEAGTVRVAVKRDGENILLTVSDDGCGMTEAVRRHACEPFFTTRAAGEGSGLGLAIVASIVRAHHGTLEIFSSPGRGTEIAMRFPAGVDPASLVERSARALAG